ncbi:glycoside hydrolase family 61 protein [Hypoxylon argillaceum]|nr:glycoside hydrolase family 61 protein [Hypoxylon argillaceum]KAI1144827.1 glycoside hydrolase family 61 protein [Nemania diffusa]
MHYLTVVSAGLLAATTSAHTIFCQLKTDQQTYAVSYAIRTPSYDGPQTDVNAANMACNGAPNPTTPSSKIIDVKAGSTISAVWRHTLQSGANDVMDPGHKGPVMAYLKKVTDATKDTGVGNGWFKIQEAGFSNGVWGTDTVINSGGNQQIHIPECIEDGQYLLRAEMVALHGARSINGAQLYMECAQINITGGKATKQPTTASIPGIYKSNDPGLLIDIYGKPPSSTNPYKIPGPALFTC